MSDKHQILQDIFGFDDFRPLQESAVDKILNHEDVLLILPTGGGKSLCYQLPGLLMEGVVVVVSPLLALMQDQVHGLMAKGIEAVMMSSMQSMEENTQAENDLREGKIKFIFVAPERLQNDYFLHFLERLKIAFFAVDEAHCVSEWGHEFRADYRQLGLLKNRFPEIGVSAFTATATTQVEKDIVNQLQFKDRNNIIRGKIFRDNLFINVKPRKKNGHGQLLDFLQSHQNERGIIYTLSRKNTESLSAFLREQGLKAKAYHAGLSSEERRQAFSDFVNDDIDIMVATIAFGMGIDKSNIRFVVHMSMPKTMEAYYQEMGRAGRDGLPSEVLLLYSTGDLGLLGHFIADIEDETYRDAAYNKLNLVKKYAFSEGCRHQALSHYFDDEMNACKTQCDNCLNPDVERSDISEQAKMFLSAIYRTEQNFGQGYVIDILLGSKNQKVLNNGHQDLSVYGIGSDINRATWKIIGDRLLEIDALIIGDFKVLKLTNIAMEIMKSEQMVDIRASNLQTQDKDEKPKKIARQEYQVDAGIFEQLRALRAEIAKEEGMPAYVIFDNKTLTEMAYFLPNDEASFLQINGVGQIKIEKYGARFLALLSTLKAGVSQEYNQELTKNPALESAENITPKTTQEVTSEDEPDKKLSITYQETLALIRQDLSIDDIYQQRELAVSTILGHINKLADAGEIEEAKKQQLFATVSIDKDINDWILQGVDQLGSIEEAQKQLSIFRQLNQKM
ncbi:DNA helicase RecQ [Bathymodiolus septemdierum thioautotrophic gill symbiont]|uniref:DNA helicase RecQ n=1 Tax=endosymbiont of Bathymodiolus septemdierum str. Myojin knoll TaxID=1303921 RepID=A0A0P0UTH4_9GAMM|nr:DNA helicase RecQ [Bathymodiolus septemdierum thioautotrophic gill symbiont]BAS68195.1 ATP-dependent DNA helicase RecQ [endosymbiont of Bathymodiolus septemdierum str. Myojin knoll]